MVLMVYHHISRLGLYTAFGDKLIHPNFCWLFLNISPWTGWFTFAYAILYIIMHIHIHVHRIVLHSDYYFTDFRRLNFWWLNPHQNAWYPHFHPNYKSTSSWRLNPGTIFGPWNLMNSSFDLWIMVFCSSQKALRRPGEVRRRRNGWGIWMKPEAWRSVRISGRCGVLGWGWDWRARFLGCENADFEICMRCWEGLYYDKEPSYGKEPLLYYDKDFIYYYYILLW